MLVMLIEGGQRRIGPEKLVQAEFQRPIRMVSSCWVSMRAEDAREDDDGGGIGVRRSCSVVVAEEVA